MTTMRWICAGLAVVLLAGCGRDEEEQAGRARAKVVIDRLEVMAEHAERQDRLHEVLGRAAVLIDDFQNRITRFSQEGQALAASASATDDQAWNDLYRRWGEWESEWSGEADALAAEIKELSPENLSLAKKLSGLILESGKVKDSVSAAQDAVAQGIKHRGERREIVRESTAPAREYAEQQTAPAEPPVTWEEMTDDQKLQSYYASGIDDVPDSIAQQIFAKAKLEQSSWRQLYEIEKEAAGWIAVRDFPKTAAGIPWGTRKEIVEFAEREHPSSWARQADEVNEQAEAWHTLDDWGRRPIPGLTRQETAEVVKKATDRWKDNYKMAVFTINSEVRRLER